MIRRPDEMGKFEFAVLAGLRAGQLSRGCTPRVDGDHTTAVFALREVAEGFITHAEVLPPADFTSAPSPAAAGVVAVSAGE